MFSDSEASEGAVVVQDIALAFGAKSLDETEERLTAALLRLTKLVQSVRLHINNETK